MIHLPAAEVIVSFRDASGSVGRTTANVAGGTEIAAARAAVGGLLGPLAAASSCAIVQYSITWNTVLFDGRGDGPQRDEHRAALIFATDQVDQYAAAFLPGVAGDLVESDGDIDIEQAAIADLAAALVAGPWTNPFGANITELLTAYLEIKP